MRRLTIWLLITIFLGELVATATSVVADPLPIGIGGSLGQPFRETISGVVEASVDILTVKVDKLDASNHATEWNTDHPEASWSRLTQQMLQVTDRDCFYLCLDNPPILKNVKEVGVTTVTDRQQMNASNTFAGTLVPGKGWRILFKPGALPLGMDKLYCYVKHDDNLSGFNILFFVIKWQTEGELWSTLHVMVVPAPPNFDKMTSAFRNKFRSGTIYGGFETVLANLPKEEQQAYTVFQQQCDAEQAARAAAEGNRQLLENGQFCPTCFAAHGTRVSHSPEQCPSLHPTGQPTPTVRPVVSPPAVPVTPAPRPTPQSSLPLQLGTAPTQPNLGGVLRGATNVNQNQSIPTQFFYRSQPVTGAITISYGQRHNPQVTLRVQPGSSIRLRYQLTNGQVAWNTRTDSEIPFCFSHWTPGTWQITTWTRLANGPWSTPTSLMITIR